MNALSEYKELKELISTKEGWKEIDELWMQGSGYTKSKNGDWLKNGASSGDKCTGIAIDPVTWDIETGPVGRDHSYAYEEMVSRLCEENEHSSVDEMEHRVIKVYMIDVSGSGWNLPFILIQDWRKLGMKLLTEVECKILELNIGLPLTRLFLEKEPGLKMMMSD